MVICLKSDSFSEVLTDSQDRETTKKKMPGETVTPLAGTSIDILAPLKEVRWIIAVTTAVLCLYNVSFEICTQDHDCNEIQGQILGNFYTVKLWILIHKVCLGQLCFNIPKTS